MAPWRCKHLQPVWILAVTVALVVSTPAGNAREATEPTYEEAECWFPLYRDDRSECGYLTVLENHKRPDGRRLQLAVAILRSTNAVHYEDPVVVINGGPGGALDLTQQGLATWRSVIGQLPAWQQRDVILLEQRGAGRSEPNLDCAEIRNANRSILQQTTNPAGAADKLYAAMADCFSRLIAEGNDLSSYTSVEIVGDLADLRKALGYNSWNIYGPSYGSRIALTAMRDRLDGLRSAVLDSVVPIEADIAGFGWRRTIAALEKALNACAGDDGCRGGPTQGAEAFQRMMREYNERPVTLHQRPAGEDAAIDVVVDGIMLNEIMIDTVAADPGSINYLLGSIQDKAPTALDWLADYMINKYGSGYGVSEGVFYSVLCNEEYPFADPAEIERDLAAYWQWVGITDVEHLPKDNANFCRHWLQGVPLSIENDPVVSEIPALLLAGEFDPLTPPEFAKATRDNLKNSFGFEFPDSGHVVAMSSICARSVVSAFVDNPAARPAPACLKWARVREF